MVFFIGATRGAVTVKLVFDWLWVRFPTQGDEIFTFIFPFLRSGVQGKARR